MKFGICIATFGESARRLAPLLDTIKRFTTGFDYEVYVRDDATPNLEDVALAEAVSIAAGAEFLRGKEWGRMAGNFHELGLHAINQGCDIIVYINDDCLMSQGWLVPITYFYEWNEKLKPGMVSGVMIEAWELTLNDILDNDLNFYKGDFNSWSREGTLLREHLEWDPEKFSRYRVEGAEKIQIGSFEPMGPIEDGKWALRHPVPLVGGLGPYFTIRANVFKEVGGFERCMFTGDYEALIGLKVWEAGYKCCMIPSPPAYHARGKASYQAYNTFPEEEWVAYRPWTQPAMERLRADWPFETLPEGIKECEKKFMNRASKPLVKARFLQYQGNQFPINIEYDKLTEINLGPIHWRDKRQSRRMTWIATHCEGRILDVGCANGGLLPFLEATEREFLYTGVDLDRVRVDEAIRTYKDRVYENPFFVIDATYGLPFPDNAFDTIVCSDMLEHIPKEKVERMLKDLARISKKRILLTFPESEELQQNLDHVWQVSLDILQELFKPLVEEWQVETALMDGFILVHLEKKL